MGEWAALCGPTGLGFDLSENWRRYGRKRTCRQVQRCSRALVKVAQKQCGPVGRSGGRWGCPFR